MTDSDFVERLETSYGLTDLNQDEKTTCELLLQSCDGSDITIMPNHHVNLLGEFDGFKFTVPSQSSAKCLPLSRTMFYGNTAAECSSYSGPVSKDVMRLLSNLKESKQLMKDLLNEWESTDKNDRAGFECIPEHSDSYSVKKNSCVYDLRAVDAKPWKPETPTTVGIYHAYVRGSNKDQREHKLFICASGGCVSACDSYYNLFLDVASQSTVDELTECQETWWLKKACNRSRARIIKMVADKFEIPVPCITDVHSYNNQEIAIPTTDTLSYDLTKSGNSHYSLFSMCTDTTTSKNGILFKLHPSEGYWVFRGPSRSSRGVQSFGSAFGNQQICGSFPTETYKIGEYSKHIPKKGNRSIITRDHTTVCRPSENNSNFEYMWPDEQFLKNLETMEWNRDNGIVELMPIVVGVSNQ